MIHKDLIGLTAASNIFTIHTQSHKVLLVGVAPEGP